jgi:hypothetical protein
MVMNKNNKIALSLFAALVLGLHIVSSASAQGTKPSISNAPGPRIDFTANPSTINIGDSSKLEWNSTSADSCKFVGGGLFGWIDASIPTSGSKVVNPSKDTTYKIYCTNKSGTSPTYVDVSVNRCPSGNSCHGATIDLRINGNNGTVKLSPSLDNPNKVRFEGSIKLTSTKSWWVISIPTPDNCLVLDSWWPGGQFIFPLGITTYNFEETHSATDYGSHTIYASCRFNLGGDTISDSVNVVIEKPTTQPVTIPASPTTKSPKSPLPTVNLYIRHYNDPSTVKDVSINITKAESAILSWISTNASNCSASGDWSGNKSTSGSQNTTSLISIKTYTYTLTCTGDGGSATDSVKVTVVQPVVKPVVQPIIGVCGSANNVTTSSIPTNPNLCKEKEGTPSAVLSGTDSWTWSCAGSNGGTTASCSAPKPKPKEDLSCTLNASKGSGPAPFKPNLTTTVSGTATGEIHYQINCGNGSNVNIKNNINPYITNDCNYQSAGTTYTVSAHVERGTATPCNCSINVATDSPPSSSVDIKIKLLR